VASIFKRHRKLWAIVKNEHGKWIHIPTPCHVGEEAKALKFAQAAQKRLDARRDTGATGPYTVARYALEWLDRRREKFEASRKRYEQTGTGKIQHRDHATDVSRMNRHILPILGPMVLADVTPKTLADWTHRLRMDGIGSKTLRNVYGLLRALFRDAAIAGLIEATPCILTDNELGEAEESEGAGRYSRDQFEAMLTSPALTDHERMFVAIGGLAGLRLGAIAGLRWGDLDRSAAPLWKLTSSRTYAGKPTKTGKASVAPVHPLLAEFLESWRHGWAVMFGREPNATDPIVPKAPGKWIDKPGSPHSKKTGGNLMDDILEKCGIEPAPMKAHALRSTFISLALEDGADRELIKRITHTMGTGRDAFARYDRADYWPKLCAEVSKITLDRVTGFVTGGFMSSEHKGKSVEAPGVEDGSRLRLVRGDAEIQAVRAGREDQRGPARAEPVTSHMTALCEAVLADDLRTAKRLAREILASARRSA
jgi:integrase